MTRLRRYWFVGAATILVSATAALAVDSAEKCQASKLKLAGKYGFCRLKAESKAIKTATPVDYSKCDAKFSGAWAVAETAGAGTCPTNGDEALQQSELTADARGMAWQLSAAPRFLDNRDGTITDHQTGLTWEKKTAHDDVLNPANPHDADNRYVWGGRCSVSNAGCQPSADAAALCVASAENDTTDCAECGAGAGTCSQTDTAWVWAAALNSASFAGHSDWRIATLPELESIIEYTDRTSPAVDVAFEGANCGPACTDITSNLCSCTYPYYYWTASAWMIATNASYIISFSDGRTDVYDHSYSAHHVRAVRGGP
jgi:hypothetical protein